MFVELEKLLDSVNLSIIVSKKSDIVSVTVTPRSKDEKSKTNNTPLCVSGTVQELDKEFIGTLTEALNKAVGFISNTEQFVKATEKKETETKAADAKKTEDAKKTTTVAGKKEEVKKYSKEETAAIATGKKALERAENATDKDMVEFLKKSAVKAYIDAKLPYEEIAKAFDNIKPATEPAAAGGLFPEAKEEIVKEAIDEAVDEVEPATDDDGEEENAPEVDEDDEIF